MTPWRRLVLAASRIQIGERDAVLLAEIFDGPQHPIEARFVAMVEETRVSHLRLTTIKKEVIAAPGGLPAGTLLDVFTVDGFRGLGLARSLWPFASHTATVAKWIFRPLHSPSRTRDGDRYARAVGGFIPPLAGGRYVECPDQFDRTDALWRARKHLDLDARHNGS